MKSIIICSDGTWQSPNSDTATHILRIARSIAPQNTAGHKQVVFYDWGIGSDGNALTGGVTGKGIDKNILDAYRFLVHNYDEGDALYFFGFSRGAYTVRSLAGLIANCGILRREHAGRAAKAYSLYRQRRQDFEPALWTNAGKLDLKQVWFAGVHSDIGGAYKNRALGDHAGQWLMQEAEACGLTFEPHLEDRLAPDYTAKQHNEYTGFYRAMRRRIVREAVKYSSPALRGLLERVGGGWEKIELIFQP